jgi:hypothetical protein
MYAVRDHGAEENILSRKEEKLADEEFNNIVLFMRDCYYGTVMECGCSTHGRWKIVYARS